MKTIAIYHKDCADGTTAAAIVLKKYPDALLFPLSHSHIPEELTPIIEQAALGDRILTVDCVIGAKEFLAAGHKVTSIDHHIGIETEYEALAKDNPSFTYVFDNNKSGASLTWSYLFPDEEMPEVVKYVEDRDIWKWRYGTKTKDVGNYVFLFANQPAEILKLFDMPTEEMERNGSFISRYTDTIVAHDIKTIEPVQVQIGSLVVPFYNVTPSLRSEIGNLLTKERGVAVGLFTIKGDEVIASFRSLDGQMPTALDLAKALGGGGHRNAAAAAMPLDAFIKAIVKKA